MLVPLPRAASRPFGQIWPAIRPQERCVKCANCVKCASRAKCLYSYPRVLHWRGEGGRCVKWSYVKRGRVKFQGHPLHLHDQVIMDRYFTPALASPLCAVTQNSTSRTDLRLVSAFSWPKSEHTSSFTLPLLFSVARYLKTSKSCLKANETPTS